MRFTEGEVSRLAERAAESTRVRIVYHLTMGERVERQTRAGKLTFEVSEDWRQTRDLAGGMRLRAGGGEVELGPGRRQ